MMEMTLKHETTGPWDELILEKTEEHSRKNHQGCYEIKIG